MKVSSRSEYALRAVLDLARHPGTRPVQAKVIARRQRIPLHYLEQILRQLARAGLVKSVRGPGGGYLLARRQEEITVGDIVRVTSGPIQPYPCLPVGGSRQRCAQESECPVESVWRETGELLARFFDSIAIGELARGRPGDGIRSERAFVFSI